MENLLLEKNNIKRGYLGDITGGISGARISFQKSHRIAIIVEMASAASDLAISFQQHTAASGGTSSNLVCNLPYYRKLDAATYFSKVASPAAASVTDADANGVVAAYVFEFLAEDLASGNTHISANLASGAVARIASVEYIAVDSKLIPAYDQVL